MPKLPSFSSSSSSSSSHHLGSLPLWLLSAFRAARMKSKASGFLKQAVSLLAYVVKAKLAAAKRKTSAVKTRLIIFSLLHNRKVLLSTISDKIHTLMAQDKDGGAATADDRNLPILQHNAVANKSPPECAKTVEVGAGDVIGEEEDEDYDPDLGYSLLGDDSSEVCDDGTGSVDIDLVKNSRGQDRAELVLEDDIDHTAELFIERFHRQMRMERLASFKRYQEMLERNA